MRRLLSKVSFIKQAITNHPKCVSHHRNDIVIDAYLIPHESHMGYFNVKVDETATEFYRVFAYFQPLAYFLKISLSTRKIFGSITEPVRFDTLPTVCHRCSVSSELWCPGAKPRKWARHALHASA